MNKSFTTNLLVLVIVAGLAACAPVAAPASATSLPPTAVPVTTALPTVLPATAIPTNAVEAGAITHVSFLAALDPASGGACTESASYAVSLDVTATGPATARYEVHVTDASGQVPDGVFEGFDSPAVAENLTFAAAGKQSVSWRLTGPYSYPDTLTIRARVNGGGWYSAQIDCATGTTTAGGDTGWTGGITASTVKIEQEQGSGAGCAAGTTYFVTLEVTANGPTAAKYEITATDASGQVPDGVFQDFASPAVSDTLTFDAAGPQRVALRLTGPYTYPDTITIRARVNGGEWQNVQVACQ